jgi:hypothetical protein
LEGTKEQIRPARWGMIFVYLRNRQRVAIAGAAAVRHRGEVIVCLGENGEELRRFSADDVWAYTREDLGDIDEENLDPERAFDEFEEAPGGITDINRSPNKR